VELYGWYDYLVGDQVAASLLPIENEIKSYIKLDTYMRKISVHNNSYFILINR
jgi:hypothetical protein